MCSVGKRIVRDAGVKSVVPAPDTGIHMEVMTRDGAQELAITRSKEGDAKVRDVGSELQETEAAALKAIALSANNGHRGHVHTLAGWRVYRGLRYFFNKRTTPGGVNRFAAERAVRSAKQALSRSRNDCCMGYRVPASHSLRGEYHGKSRNTCEPQTFGREYLASSEPELAYTG